MEESELKKQTEKQSKVCNLSDFIFEYNSCLYRVKTLKTGVLKIKEICNGIPSLIGAENKGNKNTPKWHYNFKIQSKNVGSVELSLSPNQFSSNLTFKKSIMARIPVLFSGNKEDFEIFINK